MEHDIAAWNFLGWKVYSSDDVLSSVVTGFNTLLWRQTFLNVTGQFGLTGDIPDFRIITSVPIIF